MIRGFVVVLEAILSLSRITHIFCLLVTVLLGLCWDSLGGSFGHGKRGFFSLSTWTFLANSFHPIRQFLRELNCCFPGPSPAGCSRLKVRSPFYCPCLVLLFSSVCGVLRVVCNARSVTFVVCKCLVGATHSNRCRLHCLVAAVCRSCLPEVVAS